MKYLRTNILLRRMKRFNHFGQSMCGFETVVLRGESITADNIKIKRNFKKGGSVVYQTVSLLMKCVQVQKMRTTLWHKCLYLFVRIFCGESCASYSPFFKTSLIPSALSAIFGRQC